MSNENKNIDPYTQQYMQQYNPQVTGTDAFQRSLSAQLAASQAQRTQTGKSYADLYGQAKSSTLLSGALSGGSGLTGGQRSAYDAARSAQNIGAMTDVYSQREAAMQQIAAQEAAAPMNALQEAQAFQQFELAKQQQQLAKIENINQIVAGAKSYSDLSDTQRQQLAAVGATTEDITNAIVETQAMSGGNVGMQGILATYGGGARGIGVLGSRAIQAGKATTLAGQAKGVVTAGIEATKAGQYGIGEGFKLAGELQAAGLTDDAAKGVANAVLQGGDDVVKVAMSQLDDAARATVQSTVGKNFFSKGVTELAKKPVFASKLGILGAGAAKVAGKVLGVWGIISTVEMVAEMLGVGGGAGFTGLFQKYILGHSDEQIKKFENSWYGQLLGL